MQPKSGEIVLVRGAAGGVGLVAVFVARQHGARVIAGVRLSQKAEAHLLGAESVVALNGDNEISRLPELDAIADTVGGEIIDRLIPKLKKSGRLASVLGQPQAAEVKHIDVRAVRTQPNPDRLYELAVNVKEGRLRIPISRRMLLQDIRDAHELAEKGVGKIALFP